MPASSSPVLGEPTRPGWPRPALLLLVAGMTGLVAGHTFPWPVWIGPAGAAGALATFEALRLRPAQRFGRTAHASGALLLLAVGCLGFWAARIPVEREKQAAEVAQWAAAQWMVTVEGILAKEPETREARIEVLVAPDSQVRTSRQTTTMPAGIRIELKEEPGEENREPWWQSAVRGDTVRAVGFFQVAQTAYRNPGREDRGGSLGRNGIAGRLRVRSPGDLQIEPPKGGRKIADGLMGMASRWHAAAREQLRRVGGDDAGPILVAIVLGDAPDSASASYRAFSRSGLLHVFSVSGLHAGIIAAGLFGVLSMLGVPRRIQSAAVVGGVVVYAALTGFGTPVVRTTIMVGALSVESWLRRPTDSLSRLLLAAVIVLLIWPEALFQASFQLSFLGVFALIVFAPFVSEAVALSGSDESGWRRWVLRRIQFTLRTLLLLVILQLVMLPVLAYYFQQVSIIAPLSNLVVIPLVSVALLVGAVVAGPGLVIPGIGELLGPVAAGLTRLSMELAGLSAWPDWAARSIQPLPPLGVVVYYGVLLGGAYLEFGRGPGHGARRRARGWIHAGALGALLVWVPLLVPGQSDRLRMTFLDVGQGDCTLIELPGGGTILVDAGPVQPSGVERIAIEPVFRRRGLGRVDVAVATHPDGDHIGGFPDLLESIGVRRFACVGEAKENATWQAIEERLRRMGVERWTPESGKQIRGGPPDLHLDVLNPSPEDRDAQTDRNSESIVLRVTWRKFSALLAGDADEEAEKRMLRRWGPDGLGALILKAGHHGSDSSTCEAFLEAVKPQWVVFSCGKGNRYGHPSGRVVQRCRARGASIHRTDTAGALGVETDGERLWLTTYGD